MRNVSKCIWVIVLFVILAVAAFANSSLTNICIYSPDALMREVSPRPVVVSVASGGVIRQVDATTYLRQTRHLTGQQIQWDRASIAIQVSIARKPFNDPGELVDYVNGASAFVDLPVLQSRALPRITLKEAVKRYVWAMSQTDRQFYGDILDTIVKNRTTWCSFWN